MSASGILRRGRDTRKRDFCLVAGELLRDRDRGEGRERLGSEARSDDTQFSEAHGSEDEPEGGVSEEEENGEHAAGDDANFDGERSDANGSEERPSRRRRRGRRGGRRGRDRNREGSSAHAEGGEGDEERDGENRDTESEQDEPRQQSAWVNGEHVADARAPEDIAPEARKAEKPTRQRIWDVPAAMESAEQVEIAVKADDYQKQPAPPASEPSITAEEKAPPAQSRRRHEVGSSEPRVERVVLRPGQEAAADGEAQAPPQRKGWWQRKFGGE